MTEPISRNRLLGSLKEAASWPGADRNTVLTLATTLVAARADTEGSSYFQYLSERDPADATAQALAGFFQVRVGHNVAAAITKLDKAATMDIGLPQYLRGLALAELLPGDGPSETGLAAFDSGRAATDVKPDRLISQRTSMVVGDTEFVLIPVRGGETPDALMVYLPASGLLFTGHALMPYLGVPFTAEGSPEGLLDTLRYIRELAPRQLIAGHTTLTENFPIEALAGLEPALTELHEFALAKIDENMPLPNLPDIAYLPALLRDHPAAVVPYLVSRDDFIARLHHQRTGYWQPDGQGLDPRSQEERAAALDLLAGGKADAFVFAAAALADQGDLALALEILAPGLLRHPDSSELAELRQTVLVRLMEQRQLLDPFGFLVYAELAGAELSPVR
jgi:glyoxylase-like metal-dependent hydrolase (beta-lactamase superfamily II)